MGSWRWETQGWMGWGSPFSLGLGSWLWGAYGAEVPLWGREANGGWAWGRSAPIWGSYGAGLSWLPPGGGGQGGLGPWLWGAYGAVVPLLRPRGREANGGWAWGRSAPHVGQLWGRAQPGAAGGQQGVGKVMLGGVGGWGAPHRGQPWGTGFSLGSWGWETQGWMGLGSESPSYGGLLGSGFPILTRFGAVVLGRLWGRSVSMGMGSQGWMGLGSQHPHMGQLWGRAQPGAARGWWSGGFGVGVPHTGGSCGAQGSLWGRGDGRPKGGWVEVPHSHWVWGRGCGAPMGQKCLYGDGKPMVDGPGVAAPHMWGSYGAGLSRVVVRGVWGRGASHGGQLWGMGFSLGLWRWETQGWMGLGSQSPPMGWLWSRGSVGVGAPHPHQVWGRGCGAPMGQKCPFGDGNPMVDGPGVAAPPYGAVMGQGSAGCRWGAAGCGEGDARGGLGVGVPHMGGSCGARVSLWGRGDGRPKGGWVGVPHSHWVWGRGSGAPMGQRFPF